MAEFFDLNVSGKAEELYPTAQGLGWKKIIKPALISSNQVLREARRKRGDSDIIVATGDDRINRLASECWEVDMIGSPEMHVERDFMHQMNSGIDYVIARACAERGIAIEFNFSNALNSQGRKRAQILARMAQNVGICRHCKCDMVITSGAVDRFGLRGPRDLIAFGIVLGMKPDEARAAVSENPGKILRRSEDRKDPDIILKGLRVIKWGSEKREKRIYGWY